MIHVWYLAKLPKSMFQMVRDALLPLLEDVCTKIAEKPDDTPLAKTFRLESRQTLRIVLPKRGWNRLKSYLTLPAGLTPEKAKAMRDNVANNPANLDAVHEGFSFFWPTLEQAGRDTGNWRTTSLQDISCGVRYMEPDVLARRCVADGFGCGS
jgi:hypothetical protein